MRFFFVTLFLISATVQAAFAAPLNYALDRENSRVGFQVPFGPDQINGAFPVLQTEISIDFERVSASRVSVVLSVGTAKANFPFASQAMIGPKVLNSSEFPTIQFVSTRVVQKAAPGLKAEIEGDITIRGVTRPITLQAEVFRRRDSAVGARDRLSVHLTGALSRSAFGATGWSDLVGDTVKLDMILRIDQIE